MNRQVVLASGEAGDGAAPCDDGERRNAGDRKRLDVVASEKQNDIRLGLIEHLAQLLHTRTGLVELLRVLVRRTRKHVRCMTGADGGNDFTHGWLLLRWGSAPHPGSVACGGPYAPRRSLAGAPCAP